MQPPPTVDAHRRFEVGARAWAACVLLGLISQQMAASPMRLVVVALSVAVLVVGRFPALLLALTLAYDVHFLVDTYPQPYVHTWLIFLFSGVQAWSLVATFRRDEGEWRTGFVRAWSPLGVSLAALGMFAAGFAKLNASFSDPTTSCGAVFYQTQRTQPPFSWFLPGDAWAEVFAIRLTQVAEVAGGLMMFHPRTRKVGFLVSSGFLVLVGTNPIGRLYEFASIFVAAPAMAFAWEDPPAWLTRGWRWGRWALAVGLVAVVGWGLWAEGSRATLVERYDFGFALYGFAAVALIGAVAWRGRSVPLGAGGPGLAYAGWLAVAVLAGHEAMPYFGLRTPRNLTMAANLVVNPRFSDHLLVARAPELPFNRMVVLERSSDPTLNGRGKFAMADWALFDYLGRHPDTSISYRQDDVLVTIPRAGDDPRFAPGLFAGMVDVRPTLIQPEPVRCGEKRK